ncbi:hypothetical protein L1987_64831 [Smallanthus sonchifolius]|uniref:Uncharacterized protein n=1 Tax=Smallanthus sonchifolius TaxID=185202 RepID=A0ACB9BST4_9ASTR|nr:hypothetical protein L1987_64831 [Smallanthus sonchifolius]
MVVRIQLEHFLCSIKSPGVEACREGSTWSHVASGQTRIQTPNARCSSSSKAPAEAFRDSFPPSHKSLSRLINEVPYLPKSVLKLLVCYWKWAIAQWFASVEGFREAAMDAINQVTWTHLSVPVLESEDEDGFPISFAANDKDNTSSGKKVAEESNRKGEKGQAKRKKEVDDSENKAKRKKDDSVVGHDDRARYEF